MSTRVPLDPNNPDVWAEIADVSELLSGDIKAVRKSITVTINPDGTRTYNPGGEDDIADAMLARTVRNWSFPLPLPGEDRASLDKLPTHPVDVYEALKEAIDPHIALINRPRPNTKTSSGSATG